VKTIKNLVRKYKARLCKIWVKATFEKLIADAKAKLTAKMKKRKDAKAAAALLKK